MKFKDVFIGDIFKDKEDVKYMKINPGFLTQYNAVILSKFQKGRLVEMFNDDEVTVVES